MSERTVIQLGNFDVKIGMLAVKHLVDTQYQGVHL